MKKGFLSLETLDLIKSSITAGIVAFMAAVTKMLNDGLFYTTWDEWKPIVIVSLLAFFGSVTRRFLTNEEGKFLKKDIKNETT